MALPPLSRSPIRTTRYQSDLHFPGQGRQLGLRRIDVDAAGEAQLWPGEHAGDGVAERRLHKRPGHDEGAFVAPFAPRDDTHDVRLVFMMQAVTGHGGVAFDV